jgi:hypothetical protein
MTTNGLHRVRYREGVSAQEIRDWCQRFCCNNYYLGYGWKDWSQNQTYGIVEFVDAQDAMLFSLKWS